MSFLSARNGVAVAVQSYLAISARIFMAYVSGSKILTEDSNFLITESSDYLVLE
jgi:hypothetical protein